MNIEISTDRLDADISRMQDRLDALVAAKDQVYRCLEQLGTMWEGTAHAAFTAQTVVDEITLRSLIGNLNDLIECMEFARDEYGRCSNEVDNKISSLRLSNDT